uniref:Uncharacterized protein n=1 Tax=Pristionchus pacificus TaxID=54126 RepID=A0A2A6B8S1_PRIPA|eukprot:PDM62253.1 hypothetical protein PRIPAC_51695 [Pristionchus pacificus]
MVSVRNTKADSHRKYVCYSGRSFVNFVREKGHITEKWCEGMGRGKEINREALNSIMDRLYNREMEMVTNDNKSATSTTFSTITSNG